jgi:hypothetical protein
MSIVAVIDKYNTVINIIVAEDTDLPSLDCILVNTPDNQGNTPSIGWTYDGTNFINPNPIDMSDYGN